MMNKNENEIIYVTENFNHATPSQEKTLDLDTLLTVRKNINAELLWM